jgi:hypothetical protein
MLPSLQFRWQYSPTDFFEGPVEIRQPGYEVTGDSGVVVATIEQAALEADQALRKRVESQVAGLFLGAQLQAHVAYDLSRPTVTNLSADGSKGIVIECLPGRAEAKGMRADIRFTRPDGTIVDTKRDRVQRKHRLAELAARFAETDETLSRMLRSYDVAVRDPLDELVHLYEVRDLLDAKFGNRTEATSKLGLSGRDWKRLGHLCDGLPLKQGRHRGANISGLRDATEDELVEARSLATAMIEAYMKYIDAAP